MHGRAGYRYYQFSKIDTDYNSSLHHQELTQFLVHGRCALIVYGMKKKSGPYRIEK